VKRERDAGEIACKVKNAPGKKKVAQEIIREGTKDKRPGLAMWNGKKPLGGKEKRGSK